ncbi:MAG: hypothetical protein LBB67_04930 [Oscillospiraceae bacterium]|jgi:hypothetical protein|nr:hypothetical protein [Oscillospiraceae bacterium]
MSNNNLFSCRKRQCSVKVAFPVITSDGCSVAGAVFKIACSCGKFSNAISDCNGCVTFCGLAPGHYTITQVAAPYGYAADDKSHTVMVNCNGCVKIDDLPVRCFQAVNDKAEAPPAPQSDQPDINPIAADAVTITGTGEPGSAITVIFPNGCKVCTIVRRDAAWSADVPDGITLKTGDEVTVIQETPCKLPSKPKDEFVV